MTAPKVFISYSHDSQEHKLWVLELGTRLRANGADVILDQWDLGPGGDLPHFMEQAIAGSSRILMVCTERYVEKANQGTGGVGYEKMIVTAELLRQIGSNRVIPILRQFGPRVVPTFLGSKVYIDLSVSDEFETGFDQLLRELIGAPLFQKPPLGAAPTLQPQIAPKKTAPDPISQFMRALIKVYEQSSSSCAVDGDQLRQAMGVSKLLFDHAFDLALKKGLILAGSGKSTIWVEPTGRALMLQMLSDDKDSA
jgi:hypothetical protein